MRFASNANSDLATFEICKIIKIIYFKNTFSDDIFSNCVDVWALDKLVEELEFPKSWLVELTVNELVDSTLGRCLEYLKININIKEWITSLNQAKLVYVENLQ